MNYVVMTKTQRVGGVFPTAHEAHQYADAQRQQWREAGTNPPIYSVYYTGIRWVEVDDKGCLVRKKDRFF